MTNNQDIFISNKRIIQPTADSWSCFDVVLVSLTFLTFDNVQANMHCTLLIEKFFRYSFDASSILLRLSYGALKWIRSAEKVSNVHV